MGLDRDLRSLLASAKNTSALTFHVELVLDRIRRELASEISSIGASRTLELLRTINTWINDLDPLRQGFVRRWIEREIPRAYVLADRNAIVDLRVQTKGELPINTTWTAVNQTALRGVTAAMNSTMGKAAADMRALIGITVRRTQVTLLQSQDIREATVGGLIRGSTGREISDDMASALLKDKIPQDVRARLAARGFDAELFDSFERIARGEMIKVGARTFNVRDYANLVARTQSREAATIGTIIRLQQNGVDHVQISNHVQEERDECTPFAGNVFYVGPEEKDPLGFPSMRTILNGGPPFHPNCKHVAKAWVAPFHSEQNIRDTKTQAESIPRRFFGPKTASDIRKLVEELSDKELRDLFPSGASDLGMDAA